MSFVRRVRQEADAGPEMCFFDDFRQGGLGDCCYVALLQALTTRQDKSKFVIPEDNSTGFDTDCREFHFRFYHMGDGKWVKVVMDNRIPWYGYEWRPYFTHITSKPDQKVAEFWLTLIEKAYAKFVGTYQGIEGGLA